MKAQEWTQHFPHYNSMVAMETSGRIRPNFELIQALIHGLITCKYEKNPNFELVRDVIDVLVTCKYEEDPIKTEGARVDTTFSPL